MRGGRKVGVPFRAKRESEYQAPAGRDSKTHEGKEVDDATAGA